MFFFWGGGCKSVKKLSQKVYDLIVLLRFAGVSLASNLRQFAVQANVRPVAVPFAPCWLEEVPLLQMLKLQTS